MSLNYIRGKNKTKQKNSGISCSVVSHSVSLHPRGVQHTGLSCLSCLQEFAQIHVH